MAVNVKVGLIGALDMLKFKNMAKVREQAIQAAPAKEINGDFSINKLAKELHPDYQILTIKEIIEHPGANAKTYVLGREDGKPVPYFRAGMYLSLKLQIKESFVTRAYSISSGPEDALNGTYSITIKANPGGFVADELLANLKVGDKLTTSAPEGFFYYENLRDPKNVVAIAGGSGVTPFKSMAEAIEKGIEDFNLTLIYGCKTKDQILFKEEFDKLAQTCDKFKVVYVLDSEELEGYEHGFITCDIIKKYVPEGEFSIFASGPEAMLLSLRKEIQGFNLPRRLVRFENLAPTKNVAAKEGYPKEAEGKTFNLKVKQGENVYEIKALANEPILVAIERAGIKAPSRCRSGECGWCRSKVVSGTFFIPDQDLRRFTDIEFNYIHPCCSFPTSDMEIEVPGEYLG